MNKITLIPIAAIAFIIGCDNSHVYVETTPNYSSQCSDAQYRIVRQRGQPEEVEATNQSHVHVTTYFYWSQDYSVDFEWNGTRCTVKHYYHQPVY